jgi:predicted ATPase
MADSGEGLSQVLPVIAAAALLDLHGAPARLALEEPESNLHADKHEPLFTLFTDHAHAHTDHTILIETHSRPALLTILLQIASGSLSPDDVALHWIAQHADGSVAKLAQLTGDGFIDGWPHQAFEAEPELARRLIIAQEGREP